MTTQTFVTLRRYLRWIPFFLVLLFLFVQLMPRRALGQRESSDISKRSSDVEAPLLKQQQSLKQQSTSLTPTVVACYLDGILGTAPAGGATGTLTDKINPAGTPTANCAGVTWPGTTGQAPFIYNVHYVNNRTGAPLCTAVTFTMLTAGTPTSNMQLSAFKAPFVATDITNAVRYLGDAGQTSFPVGTPRTFELTVPANTTIALVVFNAQPSPGGQGGTYRIELSLDLCGHACSGNYAISQIGGAIVPGTIDTGNHCDDCDTLISLPFPYTLYDQTFTSVNISSNGRLDFVTINEPGTGPLNRCLPAPPNVGPYDYTIFPYWDDLVTSGVGNGIFTSVSGSAPHRVFNIEFRTVYQANNSQHAHFEVRLYEDRTRFDVIYVTVDRGNTTATAGVEKNNTNFTQYLCNGFGSAATGGQSYILTTAPTDFNGDSKPDYVLYNGSTHQTAVWYMNDNVFAGGAFGPTLPAAWNVIDVADFNGDGDLDYALFNPGTHQTAIWYLSGVTFISGAFGPTLPNGWTLVALADFNFDCHPDYVLYNASTRQTAIWYMNGNVFTGGVFGPTLPAAWRLTGVADFNGNGRTDYLLFNASTRQSAIWYLSGVTFTGGAFGPTIASGYELTGTADFNGDGRPDYVLFNSSTRQTAIWYMNNNVFAGGAFGPILPPAWNLVAP
jgi:elongation factor P hydroxylase